MGELVRLETVASLNTWPKTLPYVPALYKGTTKLGAVGGKLKAPDPESNSNLLQPQLPLSVETVSTSPTEAIGDLERKHFFCSRKRSDQDPFLLPRRKIDWFTMTSAVWSFTSTNVFREELRKIFFVFSRSSVVTCG